MPTYSPTACLSTTYEQLFSNHVVNTFVPARNTHQALFDDERAYRKVFDENALTNTLKNKMKDSCNIVTAKMTLLFSEVDSSEVVGQLRRYRLPVVYTEDQSHVSFSAKDLYGENTYTLENQKSGLRDTDFNTQLHRHLDLARLVFPIDELPQQERVRLKHNMTAAILQGDFHQIFHHSEQALMRSLLTPEYIDLILEVLSDKDAATFGGIILDLFTTRYMCNNCAYHLLGFSRYYVPTLMNAIINSELRIETPDGSALLFHPRVSAKESCTTNDGSTIVAMGDTHQIHRYNHGAQTVTLQTNVSKMRLQLYQGNQFAGHEDFFLSSDLRRQPKDDSNRDTIDEVIINRRRAGLRT